jgi:hypothetical protein
VSHFTSPRVLCETLHNCPWSPLAHV